MSLMSDRAAKQKGKQAAEPPAPSVPAVARDPLSDVAVSEMAFKQSPVEALDVVVTQDFKVDPDKVLPVQKSVRAPRVRVTQKAKLMLGGTLYCFGVGQVLDSNHYDSQRFRELLAAIHTEPVEE